MKRSIARGFALALLPGLLALASCDKNGQTGVLQHPASNAALRAVVTPDKAYDATLDATLNKLNPESYLIITKAERGSVFTVHTGPLPAADHAVCFASINNEGFKECVEEYYHNAGGVAIQNNEAGWWATPL
ncbi:hypothetical protein [Hymenobacter sp. UYCo722]|uniref:hypothetical protein n=1 Tax=Hymenobacter sp. UYCo722 TaxID=3156335 RepID=UPI003395158B